MRIKCVVAAFMVSFVLAGMVFLSYGAAGAENKSVQAVISRVQKTVECIKALSCSFKQEHVWKEAERTRTIRGTIRVKEPHMIRVEYPAQTIVVDGENVWWYIPKNRQVTIQGFEEGEEMFPTPYGIFRKYVADENASGRAVLEGDSELNGRKCYILLLNGVDGESKVKVWIDRKLDFPVKSVVERANGDRTTYILSDVKLNEKLSDDIFTFEVPEGVTVVDMR